MRSAAALSEHPSFGRLAAVGSLLAHLLAAALLLFTVRMREPAPDAPEQAVEMTFEAPPIPAAPASAPEPQAVTAPDTPQATEPPPPPEQAVPPPPDEPAPPPVTPPPVEPSAPASPASVEAPTPPPVAEQPPVAQPAPEPAAPPPPDEPVPPPVTPQPVEPSAPTAPRPADVPAPPPVAEQAPVPPLLAPVTARPAPVTPRPPSPRPPPPRPLPPRPSARRAVPGDAPPSVAALPASRPPAFAPPSAVVTAPQPSPAPVAEVSPAWRGALSVWVQSHRVYPAAARAAGQEGRVGIRFTVDRTGRVLSAQIVTSSGSSLLDEGARTLLASAQLPPFPPSMTQPQQTVVLGIQYNLER